MAGMQINGIFREGNIPYIYGPVFLFQNNLIDVVSGVINQSYIGNG